MTSFELHQWVSAWLPKVGAEGLYGLLALLNEFELEDLTPEVLAAITIPTPRGLPEVDWSYTRAAAFLWRRLHGVPMPPEDSSTVLKPYDLSPNRSAPPQSMSTNVVYLAMTEKTAREDPFPWYRPGGRR